MANGELAEGRAEMADEHPSNTGTYDVSEIDEVLRRLDRIIVQAIDERSRIGYFAAIYRKVTAAVRLAILDGAFIDGQRMATLDRVFAQRFIDAHDAWRNGHQPSRAWQIAFDAADKRRLLILQHLLVGINAHINLDLGIAAAAVAPGDKLVDLKADFDTINDVLALQVSGFESTIGDLSPWIGFLERIPGNADDVVVNFSIGIARHGAWELATELAPLTANEQAPIIRQCDATTSRLGKTIDRPGNLLSIALLAIRLRETNDVATVIRHLAGS